jgi:hypothetical protein
MSSSDEMTEQLGQRNAEEAKAIANEVKMSLEKINLAWQTGRWYCKKHVATFQDQQ